MKKTPKVVCFGEVLWDMLPSGKVAGGAPMNVAYHLSNLEIDTSMISSVGNDELGEELLKFLESKSITTDLIQRNDNYPTGTVPVILDKNGSPTYEIVTNVAWDFIELKEDDLSLVKNADALVYGSLAARTEVSKTTLLELLKNAALKIFDLNLRPPFYDDKLLQELLHYADIIKLSDEELEEILPKEELQKTEREQLEILKKLYNLKGVIFTKGKEGAVYLSNDDFFEYPSFSITVKDTVGSGDSFLAAFLSQFLLEVPPVKCLQFACAMGATVATRSGGTPEIKKEDLFQFIASHHS